MKPPGTPETRILEALSRFEQLTAEQLARHLSYSFRYTQAKCKTLTEGKYLQRLTLPKRTHGGSVPYVYTLGRKGRQYLSRIAENDTLGVKKRYRPSEEQARLHTLATNEVLLKLLKQTKDDPSLSLARFIQDREFHNEPIQVPIPERSKTTTVSLIPDLWLEVRQMVGGKAYTYCFCVEVNLTPLEQKRWRRKVSLYLNCEEGYIKRVGTDVLQVLTIIATPGTVLRKGAGAYSKAEQEERQKDLNAAEKTRLDYLRWTEQELAAQNKRGQADLFLFTSAPLDGITPSELLFGNIWSCPFTPDPTSLLFSQ